MSREPCGETIVLTDVVVGSTVDPVPRDSSFLDEWEAGEREADEDFAAGRVERFEHVEDALAWLRKEDPE